MRIPAGIALRMLGGDPRGDAVRPAEDDRAAHLAAGHVARLRGRVDDLVDRLHREIEGHELDDRPQAGEAGADPEPGKTLLGDRRVDDAARPEFLQQALADLVGALVLGDLLADQKDRFVAPHLLGHCVAQRLAHRHRRGRAGVVGLRRHHGPRRRPGGRGGRRRSSRRRFGRLIPPGLGRASVFRLGLPLRHSADHRDRRVDRDMLGALGNYDLAPARPRRSLRPPSSPCRSRSRRAHPRP